jgi:hypothetical protein
MNNINYDDVHKELDKIKQTQPNIYKIWKIYLFKKENEYNNSLKECLDMLNVVKNSKKPITIEELQTILFMRKLIVNS